MNNGNHRNHRFANLVQSALLLGGMLFLLWFIGWLFAGWVGVLWTTVVGIGPLFLTIRKYPLIILRLFRARLLTANEAPELSGIVRVLSQRAGLLAPPRLHFIASPAPLAFSVGQREEGAIAITGGLLQLLNLRDLVGVLAHEISHLRSNDTWVMGLADVVSQTTRLLSLFGQVLLLINLPLFLFSDHALPWLPLLLLLAAPTISSLMQLALARTREFDADMQAARLTGDPVGLASALSRIDKNYELAKRRHRFPLPRRDRLSLLRSHPGTEERVRRLLALQDDFPPRDDGLPNREGHVVLPAHVLESALKKRPIRMDWRE